MKWAFEKEFRIDKPETIGETDYEFDIDNYREWLEEQLANERLINAKMKANGASTSNEALPIGDVVKSLRYCACCDKDQPHYQILHCCECDN